jgi:iron(III) transport system ATP-binding protein
MIEQGIETPDPVRRRAAVDVDIRNIDLSYGANHVLKDVSLHINPGEFFAFLGPSGCGKTTLLRLIAGFNRADNGEVLIGGANVSSLPPWKRDVGMVFQSYALWPHMSVAQNVAFGLEERKIPPAEIARRVGTALDLVGLGHLAERKPSQLSGGQQQRVAVARTIVIEPKVLLLDEPLSNLDARMRIQVRRELRDLQQRLNLTTIFVTHDQEEANAICDRIAIMNEGVIQQIGTPVELYETPANLFVANFLGAANVIAGRVEEGAFVMGDGLRLPLPAPAMRLGPSHLVLRPHFLKLGSNSCDAAAPAVVTHVEFLGASVRYGLDMRGVLLSADRPFEGSAALYRPGDQVFVTLPFEKAVWLD